MKEENTIIYTIYKLTAQNDNIHTRLEHWPPRSRHATLRLFEKKTTKI